MFRTLNLIDEFTRECLAIHVKRKLDSNDVTDVLTDQFILRGALATDDDGIVEYDTIYPGFYAGRAIHIHFKVQLGNQAYLTSQALFPEKFNSRVLEMPPYNAPRNIPRLLNTKDPDFIGKLDLFRMEERNGALFATINVKVDA